MHDPFTTALIYVAPFLLVITLIVTVHELGHFLTARAFGVAVDRFSIGFGRAILSWRDRSGVEWRVGWLPLGGYVRFAGDETASSVPDQTDLAAMRTAIVAAEGVGAELKYLPFKPLWQRTLVVLAGPFANFVLSTALFAVFLSAFGEPITTPRVDLVTPGSAAAKGGFQAGDIVRGAGSQRFTSFQDMQAFVQYRAGVPIDFTVDRAGATVHLVATPSGTQEKSPFGGVQTVGRLGLAARGGILKHYDPASATVRGIQKTWEVASSTVFYLGRIITGQVAADQLHSIVGIAHASGAITAEAVTAAQTAGVSWFVGVSYFLIQLAALMSVSVGLLNLLPVPTLDGGHLLFYGYELITKHPPRAGIQAVGFRAGLALLVSLMLFATWNDLTRLRVFHLVGSWFS